MVQHFLVAIFRSFRRSKTFAAINIIGLAVGLAAGLLIIQYIYFEFSFDQFHPDKERIYRVGYQNSSRESQFSLLFHTTGPILEQEVPQIEKATRLWSQEGTVVVNDQLGERSFKQPFVYADHHFFTIFDFPLRYGQPEKVLASPQSVVLSTSLAQKLFGEVSRQLLGETITLYHMFGPQEYQITGIAEDLPANSHIRQDIFFSFDIIESEQAQAWSLEHWGAFTTYVLLQPQTIPEDLAPALSAAKEKYQPEDQGTFLLEPLTQVYLRSELSNALGNTGNAQIVTIFLVVAIFILAIAWINYINLTTARASERAKEVGIRKLVGSRRPQLIGQFLLEALLFNIFSVVLALTLFQLCLPYLSQVLGKNVRAVYLLSNPYFWGAFLIGVLLGSILSGLYPAFVLSSYQPIKVLKGRFAASSRGVWLRQSLIVAQFAVSVALVGGTYVVFQQLNYMRTQNLGLDIEETMIVENPGITGEDQNDRYASLKAELYRFPFVESIVLSGNVPGQSYNYYTQATLPDGDLNEARSYAILEIDDQYIPKYQIPLIAGRNYDATLSQETQKVVLNRSAVQSLGFPSDEGALGQLIRVGNAEVPQEIIGVVANYHHKSLQNAYEPIIFNYREGAGMLSIKISAQAVDTPVAAMVEQIQQTYLNLFPGNPFDYYFLDDQFNSLYREDQRIGRLFAFFAGLAVFIACLGLFGLTAFTVSQRTKEIGVRKVLGASVLSVLRLLFRDLTILMLIAVLLALPLAFWTMQRWLSGYAFTIDYSIAVFIWPVMLVIFIGVLTVSTQTVRAARTNPAKSLRYE